MRFSLSSEEGVEWCNDPAWKVLAFSTPITDMQ